MEQTREPPDTGDGAQQTADDEHEEAALDEALEETFPSSDPIAVSISTAHVLRHP